MTVNFRSRRSLEDCKAAVRWVRANADTYKLDAKHIGAWGFSEGGRLAVLLGNTGGVKELEGSGGNADQSSAVQAVVDFGAPAGTGKEMDASPVSHASSSSAPLMILHGAGDKVVMPEQSQALDAALKKAGAKSTLNVVKGAGHDFKELRRGEQVGVA